MTSKGLAGRLRRLEQRARGVSERAYARRLRDLDKHLRDTRHERTAALALHRHGARAVLFQLEALGRLHRSTIDEDRFQPVADTFKALEDGLGAVDFHDALLKRVLAKNADAGLCAYLVGRRAEACARLDTQMTHAGWAGRRDGTCEAIDKVLEVIEATRWPSAPKERRRFARYYSERARRIQEWLGSSEVDFHELEAGVHEARRRVRWLSILPAALDGLFVRRADQPIVKALASYCTPAVVSSPFNALPARRDVKHPIELDSSAFLAMSWFINEIGAHKDAGQSTEALVAAARDLGDSASTAAVRARKILGSSVATHASVARHVAGVAKRFVRDGVLARLADSVDAA